MPGTPHPIGRRWVPLLGLVGLLHGGCSEPLVTPPGPVTYKVDAFATGGLSVYRAEGQPTRIRGSIPLHAGYSNERFCSGLTMPDEVRLQRETQTIPVRTRVDTLNFNDSGCWFTNPQQMTVSFSDETASPTPVWTLTAMRDQQVLGSSRLSFWRPDPIQGYPDVTVTREGDAIVLNWKVSPGAQEYTIHVFDAVPGRFEQYADTTIGLIDEQTTSFRIDTTKQPGNYQEERLWEKVTQARKAGKPLTVTIHANRGLKPWEPGNVGDTPPEAEPTMRTALVWTHVSKPVTLSP